MLIWTARVLALIAVGVALGWLAREIVGDWGLLVTVLYAVVVIPTAVDHWRKRDRRSVGGG